MIESEIDVIERVANLMSNRCRESAYDRPLLSFMQLSFEFSSTRELRGHLVERGRKLPHFIATFCGTRKLKSPLAIFCAATERDLIGLVNLQTKSPVTNVVASNSRRV